MNAKDILTRKFEKGFNGYKTDDVDEFVKEISEEFGNLQKENRELEKKLEVLADRIREYRNDEDALKEALLGAQKQGQQAIADAKEKAKNIIGDAEAQSDVIKKAAEEFKSLRHDEGEKLKSDAEREAANIVDEANKKAEKISIEMNYQIEMNREILTRIKNETADFSERIVDRYKEQIERLAAIPGECENEYIERTVEEHNENMAARQKTGKVSNVNSADIINRALSSDESDELNISKIYNELEYNEDKDDDFEYEYENNEENSEVNELTFTKVFEEDSETENGVEDFDAKDNDKASNVNNNIFFKKSGSGQNKKEPLDFGNQKNDGKKK